METTKEIKKVSIDYHHQEVAAHIIEFVLWGIGDMYYREAFDYLCDHSLERECEKAVMGCQDEELIEEWEQYKELNEIEL